MAASAAPISDPEWVDPRIWSGGLLHGWLTPDLWCRVHRWEDVILPKPYPREFRDDVVRVAVSREPGVPLRQIAADFGISETCLQNWVRQAAVDLYFRDGGYIDWIKSDSRFQAARKDGLASGNGTFAIWIQASEPGGALAEGLRDVVTYANWPVFWKDSRVPQARDYDAQVGSFQGTMTVTRVGDGRLKIEYRLNNTLTFESAAWIRPLGAGFDVSHRNVTQHFIWTEYVSG